MSALFWIALGSAIGGMGRYWCSGALARRYGEQFPWGTLFVNVMGSLVIGLAAGLGPNGTNLLEPDIRQFVMVGLCGGYTTFSSFSLQTLTLARDGQWSRVWANIIMSAATCFIAVWIGFAVALRTG